MKIQCKVCIESPIIEIPDIEEANDGQQVYCPSCEKWIATANIDEYYNEWSVEDEEWYDEGTGKIIKNYPVKIIEY